MNCVEKINYYRARLRGVLYNLFPNIKVGKRTLIEPGAKLTSQFGGVIEIGSNSIICRGALLLTHGGNIKIGNNASVNPYTVIYGQGGVEVSDNVRIAAHCVIVPSNHIYDNPDTPIYLQGLSIQGIIIESDVWLGAGVKVLDGVTISRGCVVGANSVVTRTTEPYGVYVGSPARRIKNRGEE